MQANSVPPGKQPEAEPQPTNAKSPSLGKTFSLVGILTTFSKFLGFARDIIVFHAYGAGYITDAYNYASLLTANILILFGGLGGPFHQSTVAVIEPRKEDAGVGKLIFQLVSITALVLSVITLLIYCATPYLVTALSRLPSTSTEPKLWTNMAMQLQIMLPLILISGVIGILYGISNVYGEFKWPSLSPAIASVAMIAFVLIFPDQLGLCLAYGTLVGAILQLLAQLPATLPHMRWQFSLKPEPGAREYTSMLWPATISTSIGTLTVYVDALFVSSIKLGPEHVGGAWTAIVNSNRLVQLPLGILLTAMLVPILPRFTQQVTERRIDDLKAEFHKGLRILWFLSLPISALLIAIPFPILQLLYQRGKFTAADTQLFSLALVWLAPSILFYMGRDLITRVFYAHQDSKTPYRVAMVAIVLKGFLDWVFVCAWPLGVGGISLSTTLVTVFNLSALAYWLRKKIGNLGTKRLLKPLAIMLAGSAAAGITSYFVYRWIGYGLFHLSDNDVHVRTIPLAVSLAISSALAFAVYLAVCVICKLDEPHAVVKRFLPSKPRA